MESGKPSDTQPRSNDDIEVAPQTPPASNAESEGNLSPGWLHRNRWWIGTILTMIGLVFAAAAFFIQPLFNRSVECSIDLRACAKDRESSLTEIADLRMQVVPGREVTVVVTELFEVTVPVPIESTVLVMVTQTQEPEFDGLQSQGSCADADAPCRYDPESGHGWLTIASKQPWGDSCRWPEIANVNRLSDGTYDLAVHPNKPILIPPVAPFGTHRPQFRTETGMYAVIPDCGEGSGFPCMYSVDESLRAFNYQEVALKFYGAIYHGGIDLPELIANANLRTGCPRSALEFKPGDKLVIPVRPFTLAGND